MLGRTDITATPPNERTSSRTTSNGGRSMKTGLDVIDEGLYVSECCSHLRRFAKDQTFTRCPKSSALTVWEVVEEDEVPQAA